MQRVALIIGENGVHLDILNESQKKVLSQLAYALAGTEFYMAGGTALALHIGHRLSIDFDWFITTFENPEKLFQRLEDCGIVFDIKSVDIGTVYMEIDTVQVSFIGYKGSRKDFIDLYFLINFFRSLEDYLKLYMQKYQNRDVGHVIRSLVYFQDAEAEPETIILKPFDWQDMKANLEKWVKCLNVL